MGRSIIFAAILTLLGGMAFAGHALAPDTAPVAKEDKATSPEASPTEESAQAASPEPQERQAASPSPAPIVVPAPKVEATLPKVTLPSELDIYLVPAATREVCTTRDWGSGEVETDCRVRPIPVQRADPKLRGLCITRYGQRVCY